MCTSNIGQGGAECEWFPDFQGASCKSHTFLSQKGSQNPLLLGGTWKFILTSCLIQVKSPFHLHCRTGCCSTEPGPVHNVPGPCVNVRHNHVNFSHVHSSKVYLAGPPLHDGTEGLTSPCFHGSCSLMEIISTWITLTECSSWARYCSWSSICINSFNPQATQCG